jgi:hypothetical protein
LSDSDGATLHNCFVREMALISDLASRFGLKRRPNSLVGHIDGIFSGAIRGWIDAGGASPASVIVRKNGEVLGSCEANQFRADLMQKGIRNGRCGFSLALLKDEEITIGDLLEVEEAHAPNRKLALRMTTKVFNKTLGSAELIAPDRVAGWVYMPWQPKRRLNVEVRVGNRSVAKASVNVDRRSMHGLSQGRSGFDIELKGAYDLTSTDAEPSVRCIESGVAIPIAEAARVSGAAPAGKGGRWGMTHAGADTAATTQSAEAGDDEPGSPETLMQENERLRTALADRDSELARSRLQLQQLQEEMEHWFLQYLDLQKSVAERASATDVGSATRKSIPGRKK